MKRLSVVLAVSLLSASIQANAALSPVAGGLGVYDSVNNVTWTSDGNLFVTQASTYAGGYAAIVTAVIAASGGVMHDTPNASDTPPGSCNYNLSVVDFTQGGQMTWWGAQAWVNYLNKTKYSGSNQWALPTTVDSNSSLGYPNGAPGDPAQSSSQLAELFYGGLGQVAGIPITSTHNTNYALFSNIQGGGNYISATEDRTLFTYAWALGLGYQRSYGKDCGCYWALAVSPGQLSGTASATSTDGPIPLWALGVLGAGLIGIASRQLKKPA